MENLRIIGTSHIAKESINEVEAAFLQDKPDILAIELDRQRLQALIQKKKPKIRLSDIRHVGLKGFLFSLIGGWAERKLGKVVGVEPGAEMMTAFRLAKKDDIPVALIDQNIEITLRRISQELKWKEKINLAWDIIKSAVLQKNEFESLGIESINLAKVPEKEIIEKLTKEVKKRYPGIYKVLISERDNVMAVNIHKLMTANPGKKLLVIVGAGHEESILSIIKKL